MFMQVFWPAMVIFVGFVILFRKSLFKKKFSRKIEDFEQGEVTDEDKLEEVNIFGGSKKRYSNKQFKGGEIVNIFGGSELNLIEADLPENGAKLECVNIFGGIVIIVPNDWTIRSEMVSIFGGFNDKRHHYNMENPEKVLVIKGVSLFGGGEVKN